MDKESMKRLQYRRLHTALGALKEDEQDALASYHAEHPEMLIHRFSKDVDSIEGFEIGDEEFHGDGRRPLPDPPSSMEGVTSTNLFTSVLEADSGQLVKADRDVEFRYVDREIFPLRTTVPGGPRPDRVSVDLLLASPDGLPIIGELKVKRDKPAYPALIQALRYTVELSSASQISRIASRYHESGVRFVENGPRLEVLLLSVPFTEPETYWKSMRDYTEQISEKLMHRGRVAEVVRRISYVEAVDLRDGKFDLRTRFSFESQASS